MGWGGEWWGGYRLMGWVLSVGQTKLVESYIFNTKAARQVTHDMHVHLADGS